MILSCKTFGATLMKILYLFWFHHNSSIGLSQRLKNAVMKPNQNISEKKNIVTRFL